MKRLHHFAVSGVFAFLFVFTVLLLAKSAAAVIDVMLHCYGVSRPSRLLINFKDFASLWVIFQLLLERVVWAGIIVPRKSPTLLWSWELSNG